MDELTVIMRSLGMSPTISELRDYMKQKVGPSLYMNLKGIKWHGGVQRVECYQILIDEKLTSFRQSINVIDLGSIE